MSKADLLMSMPQSADAQKAVKNAIKERLDSLIRVDGEKELQKSINETVEEKYGVSGKFVAVQAALLMDDLYNEGKKRRSIEEQSELLEIFDGTFKGIDD